MAKKKSKPQSDNNKPPKPQNQAMDEAASEKLESLKSLNAMLLKETVERRQQVDALNELNKALESELKRCNSDKVSLQSELTRCIADKVSVQSGFTQLSERVVTSEIETRLVFMQVDDMAEKIEGLEGDLNLVMEEKSVIEEANNAKELEIFSLTCKLDTLLSEISDNKSVLSQVCEDRDGIRAQLDARIQHESVLSSKVSEVEKRETVVSEKFEKLKADYDGLVEEKTAIERKVESMIREKGLVERSLVESNALVDELKRDIEEMSNEKAVLSHGCEDRNEIRAQLDARIQHENVLSLKLKEAENREVAISEKFGKLKIDYDVLVEEKLVIERRVESMLREKDLIERRLAESNALVVEFKRDIDEVVKEKIVIEDERNVEERKKNELQNSVEGLKDFVHRIQKNEEQLLVKVADLEKKCVGSLKNEVEMHAEINALVKEKQETEGSVKRLAEEKVLVMKDLEETRKTLEHQKRTIKQIVEEKTEFESAKNQVERNIVKMNEQLCKFKKMIGTLEKSSMVQSGKIEHLEAEVSRYRASFNQATTERNEARENLDEEKLNMRNLREKISNLEKGIKETNNKLTKMKLEFNQATTERNEARENLDEEKLNGENLLKKISNLEKGINETNNKLTKMKLEFDQATSERNDARENLESEKLNGKNLREKISNLEKGIKETNDKLTKMKLDNKKLALEKNELDNTCAVLVKEVVLAEKTIANTRKDYDDMKCKLGLAEANSKRILKILKNASMICRSKQNDQMGVDQEIAFSEGIKHYVIEVEAIKKAFKDKESIILELKKQLEALKVSLAKARKGESFWTLVSTGSLVLTVVLLACVARAH